MRKTNPSISDEEVSKIVSEVDLDGDGTINFDGKRTRAPFILNPPVWMSGRGQYPKSMLNHH